MIIARHETTTVLMLSDRELDAVRTALTRLAFTPRADIEQTESVNLYDAWMGAQLLYQDMRAR